MTKPSVRVEGEEEVNRALRKTGEFDLERAGTEAGRNLLPEIKGNTPIDTGRMVSGWQVEQSAFINDVDYAGYVEFGTRFIDGADAIRKAVDAREDLLLETYEKEVERAGTEAGLSR